MNEFKEIFAKVAVSYAEYVEQKVKEAKERSGRSGNVDNYKLIDEVRALNAIGATLARFEVAANEQKVGIHKAEISEEKQKWLEEIGAKKYPEPITHIYTFRGYNGAFNLSDQYITSNSLEELKAQYEENKLYVSKIITEKAGRGCEQLNKRLERQLRLDGLDVRKMKSTLQDITDLMANSDLTLQEGLRVANMLGCMLEEKTKRNPCILIKQALNQDC